MYRGCLLAGIAWLAGSASAQTSRPAFEVAAIRLNTHCDTAGRSGGASTPGRISLECADLRDLILTAYGIYGSGASPSPGAFRMQVVGGPAWMDSTRYDIVAKPAGNPPRSEMFGPMLQSLLEDRFGLKVHREVRDGRIYLLAIARNGPKLHATKAGTCLVADIDHPPGAGNTLAPVCGKPNIHSRGPAISMDIPGAGMANLCAQLGLVMDGEVVDRTDLAGRFDIHLEVAPDVLRPKFVAGRAAETQSQSSADGRQPSADDADTGPSIFTALRQQLGLKLQAAKGPVQVIVVDRIERPTEN